MDAVDSRQRHQLAEARGGSQRAAHSIGTLIRLHRIRRNMTQQQLADFSTVSIRAIRDLERGRARRPRRETVHLIADGLKLAGPTRDELEAAAGLTTGAPNSVDLTRTAPPAQLSGLIGREVEEGMLRHLIGTGEHRLISVTGLPGVGTTALALSVAHALHDSLDLPVYWLASVLDLIDAGGVDAFAARVGERPALLVLDGAAPTDLTCGLLAGVLRRCRQLRVMVTGTDPFPAAAAAFPLAPLPIPVSDGIAVVAASPSVRLLLRQWRQLRPASGADEASSAALAGLCRQVDGLPRALELMGQWLAFYEPVELLRLAHADAARYLRSLADHRSEVLEPIRTVLADLSEEEQALLDLAVARPGEWSVSDLEQGWRQPLHALGRALQRLLLRGVIRPAGGPEQLRFTLPNLVALAFVDECQV